MQPKYYGAAADYNKPKHANVFNQQMLFVVGIVLAGLLIILVLFALLGSLASGPRNDIARLAAREQQLQKFITSNIDGLKDSDLKKVSAEANLLLGSDVASLIASYGGDLPKDIIAAETDSSLTNTLEEAAKVGKINQTYRDILQSKLTLCIEAANKVASGSSGQGAKSSATEALTNLNSLVTQLKSIAI